MSGALDQLRNWWTSSRAPVPELGEVRWVVVDVETSGLDASRDRLLAIAAVALRVDAGRRLEIALADSFEVVIQQETVSDRDNILLHGIGQQRQREGMAPERALASFARFTGESPLLAFHSAFDQTLIDRYCQRFLGHRLRNPWLDVADLCAVTHDTVRARSLDDWMAHFDIRCLARHQASADALATAELMLRLWPRLVAEGGRWSDLARLAAQRRWLGQR